MNTRYGRFFTALAILPIAAAMCAAQQGGAPGGGGGAARGPQGPPLQLSIDAFPDGAPVPLKYSCLGTGTTPADMHGTSPAMTWKNAPAATQSFVVIVHDAEPHPAKGVIDNLHWTIWNIPATATGLPEGVPSGATLPDGSHQVKRGMGAQALVQYYGPCAPPGPDHHYIYEVWALDSKLDLPVDATRPDVQKAADGHILAASIWVGKYHRPAAPTP